jgi:hypothetical protein
MAEGKEAQKQRELRQQAADLAQLDQLLSSACVLARIKQAAPSTRLGGFTKVGGTTLNHTKKGPLPIVEPAAGVFQGPRLRPRLGSARVTSSSPAQVISWRT